VSECASCSSKTSRTSPRRSAPPWPAKAIAVGHALDATSALDFAAVHPYDLVILDRILPTDHLWTGPGVYPQGVCNPARVER
jgi:hypothetical protein